jgi:S1-C subfamily serine protease
VNPTPPYPPTPSNASNTLPDPAPTDPTYPQVIRGYAPVQPSYSTMPPITYPPATGHEGAPPPSPPNRRRAIYAAGAALVLIALITMFAIGHATGASSPTASSTPGGGATVAVPAAAQDLQQTVINVVRTAQPSVVEVTSTGQAGEAIGSGVIFTSDGYIVTNDHVVTGFSSYTVTLSSGKTVTAQLTGEDAQDDLAVLKVDQSGLRPIALGDSGKVVVGQFSIALGNPLGLQQSATFGIVSALNRTASEAPDGPAGELTGLIQTSAPINPGNSGGALVDLSGKLIGIPTLGAVNQETGTTAAGIGFAIPVNRAIYVEQQLVKNGHLTSTGQGFLGIQGEDVTPEIASANGLSVQQGVLVTNFANDAAGSSPAQSSGVKTGDVITAVNGQSIVGNADLASVLLAQSPGASVALTIQRGSSSTILKVTLGERPTNLQG